MPKGYVYILTNPSFREDWVKIGKTSRPVDTRSKELDNTAVPLRYEIFAVLETEKYAKAEAFVQKQIDRLTNLRIRKNREFFNIAPKTAADIFEDIAKLLGEEAKVIYYEKEVKNSKQEPKTSKKFDTQKLKKKKVLCFASYGIKNGSIITYKHNNNIKAIVADTQSWKVKYKNKIYPLAALTREMEEKRKTVTPSGSYCGADWWNTKVLL
jgi:hypothetical protein